MTSRTLVVVAATTVGVLAAASHPPTLLLFHQSCPAPRPSQWAAIRDSLWPLLAHRDGDEAWAHLDGARLPGQSALWCNPLQGDTQAVRAGRALYAQQCATCHGDQGKGDGAGAAETNPATYDFTRPEFAGMREPPGTAVLYAIVSRGIEGTFMRAFADDLSGWERLAVLAYVTQMPGTAALQSSRAWADTLRARKH